MISILAKMKRNSVSQKQKKHLKLTHDINLILDEVKKDIEPIFEEDRQTAEFLRKVMSNYRLNSYIIFKWIDEIFKPEMILYPASGFDRVPKIAFGNDRVIHTSLEDNIDGDKNYFDELGDGINIIADNNSLPFKSSSFDAILILDSPYSAVGEQRDEILRVLNNKGILIFARNIFWDDSEKNRVNHYKNSYEIEEKSFPSALINSNDSEVEFHIFRKKMPTD